MPEKKDYVFVSKGVHKQKLCNLQELHTAFKEKHLNVNIGFSKYCTLRPKWCVLTNSVFVSSVHQNGMLLVNAIGRSRRSFATLRATNASCIGMNSVLALQL